MRYSMQALPVVKTSCRYMNNVYYVIDTNVWLWTDKPFDELDTVELQCLGACRNWMHKFVNNTDFLAVDTAYAILREYRENFAEGSLPRDYLNRIEKAERLDFVSIEFDADGFARLPETVEMPDRKDRKFAAVAITHPNKPPIINASDTDWQQVEAALAAFGITLIQLCSDYLERHHKD